MKIVQLEALPKMANYNWILRCEETGFTAAVDPSERDPICAELEKRDWKLDLILCTHHHWDHTGGNIELRDIYGCDILCHESDNERTPAADAFVKDGDTVEVGKHKAKVIHIPGHTTGQVAFYFEAQKLVFVGDTLFNFGCGRVMEGTYEQMHSSLAKLKALPKDTMVYCGHEYTVRNLEFCMSRDSKFQPDYEEAKKLRDAGQFTVPFQLGEQMEKSPFLRDSLSEFSKWRDARNAF